MSIIIFLNQNGGAIIAIATVVLVGVTLWYVIETMRMRRTTQEMLKVSNTPEIKVSLIPEIFIYDIKSLYFCIQNIGTGFAYDVEITGTFTSFQPKSRNIKLGECEGIKKGISHLGPGKRYQFILLPVYEKDSLPKEPFNIVVTYRDSVNEHHSKTFPFDSTIVEDYPQLGDPSIDSIAKSLRRIDYNLSEITKKYAPDPKTKSQ